jgi:hypothetical protein
MDKSCEENTQKRVKNNRQLFKYVPLLFVIGGLLLFGCGSIKLHELNMEIGTETVEQLNEELPTLSDEYDEANKAAQEELEKNGYSEKYNELVEKATEIKIKISSKTNSRYVKETGDGNPDSIGDIFMLIPTIPIGIFVVILGVVLELIITKEKKTKK